MSGFGVNTSHIPCVSSYVDAALVYEKSREPKCFSYGHRHLGHERKPHMSVRKSGEDYVFQLYGTDVITYHEDGSVSVDPYKSSATNRFFERLCPRGMSPYFTYRLGCAISLSDTYYLLNHQNKTRIRLVSKRYEDGTANPHVWTVDPSTPPVPFTKTTIDRKAAKAALAPTRYRDFRHALLALRSIDPDVRREPLDQVKLPGHDRGYSWAYQSELLRYQLANPEHWRNLCRGSQNSDAILTSLREAIYSQVPGKCKVTTEEPFLTDSKEFWSYARANRW